MFKKLSLAAVALSIGAAAIAPSAAEAQRYNGYGNGYGNGYNNRGHYDRDYDARRYDNRRYHYRDRGCSDGATGTVVGAIAGGLLGRTVDTRGDRLGGTLIGGVAGALAGRAIDKSGNRGYCR
ncbi:MAG: glycine zipper 2TM domain-containing protein [Candidatus Sphingomonas colombiensis]|nr:glycine zipper 2TM domain-containing protein [Sphingomonas sp.]WEK44176.1 MAG: glycine zipper 2TM domain-containing protein [Sphingomonas sp.]